MPANIEMDWVDPCDHAAGVAVSWQSGARPDARKVFFDRGEGEAFACGKLGKRGMIMSLLDMSGEQREKHDARMARIHAALDAFL